MNHADIEQGQLIDLYLMDRLDPGRAQQLEEHLLGCEQCTRALELQQQFVTGIRQLGVRDFQGAPTPDRWRMLAMAASVLLAITGPLSYWSLQEVADLRSSHEQLLATDARILVMPLVQTRSSTGIANVVELGPVPQRIVFELEGDFRTGEDYEVRLTRGGEDPVQRNRLQTDYRGLLVMGVLSTRLNAGAYQLEVAEPPPGGTVHSYSLQVRASLP